MYRSIFTKETESVTDNVPRDHSKPQNNPIGLKELVSTTLKRHLKFSSKKKKKINLIKKKTKNKQKTLTDTSPKRMERWLVAYEKMCNISCH